MTTAEALFAFILKDYVKFFQTLSLSKRKQLFLDVDSIIFYRQL